MMADAPAYRFITGAELVSLLREADVYMQKRGMYAAQSVELGQSPAVGPVSPGGASPATP